LKDRLGDQRGGSEWEPIKTLLQIKNSAYAPNSQPRIPTRVCQGHVLTTNLPILGTNSKQSQSGSTNQEAKDLATLTADRPRGTSKLFEKDSQTSSTAPTITDRLWRHLGPSVTTPSSRTVRGPQADCSPNSLQLKTAGKTDQKKGAQEQATNTKNTEPVDSTRTVRGLQADCPPGTNRAARAPNREHNLSYPSMDLPNGLSS
jgi:hypothetical protein